MVDLKEYPLAEELRKRLTTAAEMERAIFDAELIASIEKARADAEVCNAVNEAGKPLYSNETLRSAAALLALRHSDEYVTATFNRRDAAFARAIALAEAEAIKNAIRLACATARVGE